ncbi:IS3 family transposase [Streptosporangium sp. 'caverna']|uniref:IS3 family transposase n=1 Tax=Streptosporangium sp. 'caverna' TaxID=2202249 RepID=UPI000D7E8D8A|nr:IS3 family transposase [Streptosporangium sp. 'caverna']AWS48603.1 IS3 family transposase [Streptosporangium sp. 'caverna']
MVELVRAGRSPEELAKEFQPSAQSIRVWVRQADLDDGRRADGLTSAERDELARLRRENKILREEKDVLRKAGGFLRAGDGSAEMKFRLIHAEKDHHDVSLLARVLGVSRQGYYAWTKRGPSTHARQDQVLTEKIRTHHAASDEIYGAPRIHADLREIDGIGVGRKQVAQLMRAAGLARVSRRKGTPTTNRDGRAAATDLVRREFRAAEPNRIWTADITYVPTWQGFLYLAVVLDVFSRRIVGWAMADHMRTELVTDALAMAIHQRRPEVGVIHHSDKGGQYTSMAFGRRCEQAGVRPSTGHTGTCFDNAITESFFASLECELIDRRIFRTRSEAERAIFAYIEGFYNPRRRHFANGQLSPVEYERRQALKLIHEDDYAAA